MKRKWHKAFLGFEIVIAILALVFGLWASLSKGMAVTPTFVVNDFLSNIRGGNYSTVYNNHLSGKARTAFGSLEGFQSYLNGSWPGDVTGGGTKLRDNEGDLVNPTETIQGSQAVVQGTLLYQPAQAISAKFLLVYEDYWRILSIQIPGSLP